MRLFLAALVCAGALAGCEDPRSFDERYNDTEQELQNRTRNLDQELAADHGTQERNDTSRP